MMQMRGSIDALACAYAELSDFDSAIRYEEQAINVETTQRYAARKLHERLSRFQRHRPAWE